MGKKSESGFWEKLRKNREKEDPLRNVVMRVFDADIDSPDVYFMMDEVGKDQILRKYDKSTGTRRYAGTYKILYKTNERDKFYLIMTRIQDELKVDDELQNISDELDVWIVCSYTPGIKGRIYLHGLPEETVSRITNEYARKR